MITQNKKLMICASFLFIATAFFFQNCSVNKSQLDSASAIPGFEEDLSNYDSESMLGTQAVNNGNIVLKEYRYIASSRYIHTGRAAEQTQFELTYASSFEVTGNTITLRAASEAGLSPVYRLMDLSGFRIYTADNVEKNTLIASAQWKSEGVEGYAVKINPGASCPSSPVMTYPVNRLFHASKYKYRLVSDSALKSQLASQGYVDQGISFCAVGTSSSTPVIVTPPVCTPLVCAPPSGFTYSNPTYVNSCMTSCGTLTAIPVIGGTQSCQFGTQTIAHGQSIVAYQSATVSSGSCVQQTRVCNDGALSGSYTNLSCSVVSVPTPTPTPTGPGDMSLCAAGSSMTNLNYTSTIVEAVVSPTTSRVYKLTVPSTAVAMSILYQPRGLNEVPGTVDIAISTQRPCAYGLNTIGYTNSFTGGGTISPQIIANPPNTPYVGGAKVQAGSTIYISIKGRAGVNGTALFELSLQ